MFLRRRCDPLLVFTLVAVLSSTGVPASAVSAGPGDTLSAADRRRAIDELHQVVTEHYAHWAATPAPAFEQRFARYRRQALATPNRRDFSLLTRAMVASLRNGHTTFSDPWMLELDSLRLGFDLAPVGRAWIVTRSARPELPVGSEIARVDDQPIESFYASVEPYLCASSDRARRLQLTARGFLWPRAFTLTTADHRTLRIERRAESPARPASPPSPIEDRWLTGDSIAYLAIRGFDGPSVENQAIELLRTRYAHARALIVDVRGNGGGDTPRRLTKTLLGNRPYTWWKIDPDRAPESFFDRIGAAAKRAEVVRPSYDGALFVLTDGGCASSCEDFLMPLVWAKRATVVGDTTLGSTGQPVFTDLGAGMRASVGARRAYFPDGSTFEGVGIAPHVLVRRTREDIVSGEDRVLATALALARRSLVAH